MIDDQRAYMDETLQAAIVCEATGWTYPAYESQPDWLRDLICGIVLVDKQLTSKHRKDLIRAWTRASR